MAGPRLRLRQTSLPMAGPKHQIRRTSLPMAGPKHQIRRTSLPMAGPWDKLRCAPPDLPAYGRTGHPLWNLQSYWMAGRGAAAENMDQKRIWKPRSSRFSSPTSIVCQGLVQTGLALHPMSRNRWSLEISSLKMFRLQCRLFLTQDVSPAVWGWHLLNARCFACSFGMAPSCLPFQHCNINFSCHSNIALWSAIL